MYGKNIFEITRQCIGCKGIASYIQRGIALIATAILLACNINHSNVQNGHELNDNVAPEQPAVVAQIDSALVSKAYAMTNVSAGPFRIGAVIRDTMDGFEVEKSTECRILAHGVKVDIPIRTYYIGNEGWIKITPQYDTVTGQASDKIGEIHVYSELFLTDKCIGAISSLEDLASVYPDINIRYIGEDDMFAVVTSQLPNVQFLIEREHYIGMGHDSDSSIRNKLELSDFNEKSHFYAVRIIQQ